MAPEASEADIIFNRANVALAKSQRLVASWLPPRTEQELRDAKSEEEIEKEEQEMFAPVPEVLGLGAAIPDDMNDEHLRRQKMSSHDQLRRQLLGKDYAKLQSKASGKQGSQRCIAPPPPLGSKPRPTAPKRQVDDVSSEEEDGRSRLGRKRQQVVDMDGKESGVEQRHHELGAGPADNVKVSRKTTSYLDEVLSRKQKKPKNKKRKKAD
ncbi:MAG: hypothetical protein Q9183_001563 [Haloplaca sp. 2 TL-2023]